MTKADAETICAFHQGWLVDMDEGRGDDDDDDDAHIKMMTQDGSGPQKNNLIKSLISEVDPHVPQIPGMQ